MRRNQLSDRSVVCDISRLDWAQMFFFGHKQTCRAATWSLRRLFLSILIIMVGVLTATAQETRVAPVSGNSFLWNAEVRNEDVDNYVAFRGQFDLATGSDVEFQTLGASWYVVWVDGEYFAEGPARFHLAQPEYQTNTLRLVPGKHTIAVQVHHIGVATRMMAEIPPFFHCKVRASDKEVFVYWKSLRLRGYDSKVRRINAELGWIEWCDTRKLPAGWQSPGFDDREWKEPIAVQPRIGKLQPLSIGNVRTFKLPLQPLAQGVFAETFGYERDDPSARFFLRDLDSRATPPQGVWRRYDLGRVRLGRPRFVMSLPPGAVVEFSSAEYLREGRVGPWITLSASDSCNLDHYVARGGRQEFFPLTPKGGRFLEIHVIAPPDQVRFLSEEYFERGYYSEPEGEFRSGDELLDRIWRIGIETHRACAEDAIIDNPTRERGQWTGDVVSVGMDIAAAGYSDLRLFRRALIQSAQSARQDGLISSLSPGQTVYLTTYAAQWTNAVLHYLELTGDRRLLGDLYRAALQNMAVSLSKTSSAAK